MTNAQLRGVFADNLKKLVEHKFEGNVSQAARAMGINRTQLNRYLSGESTACRPDVITRICEAFEVDARIVNVPLEKLRITYAMENDEIPLANEAMAEVIYNAYMRKEGHIPLIYTAFEFAHDDIRDEFIVLAQAASIDLYQRGYAVARAK